MPDTMNPISFSSPPLSPTPNTNQNPDCGRMIGIISCSSSPPSSTCPPAALPSTQTRTQFSIVPLTLSKPQSRSIHLNPISATLNSPKGFGPSQNKTKNSKKPRKNYEEEEEEEEDEREEGVIPEIVTNRMMSRIAFTVGTPLFIGLLFFPFFYYLKVGLKIDVPTWIPFVVSFIFFGTALAGVSYGIVSASWDPMREGSFWGWKEAKKNAPVFWQSIFGGSKRK